MNCEQLKEILNAMPEIVDMQKFGKWGKNNLEPSPWWRMNDPSNCLERAPKDVIDGEMLSIKYDNAALLNQGYTPTKKDFELLGSCECEHIDIDDLKGVLFYNAGRYLFFPQGTYWTSSYTTDEIGKITPWCVEISSQGVKFTQKYNMTARLFIRGKQISRE